MGKLTWNLEIVPLVVAALVCLPTVASASASIGHTESGQAGEHEVSGVDCPWRENVAAWMAFDIQRSTGKWSRGLLINHISYSNGCRFIYHHLARSGDEKADHRHQCAVNWGPLPTGVYVAKFQEKTWGHDDVKGWVWYLGEQACYNGTVRKHFYLHSKGYPNDGWSNGDYFSLGCIKINQKDRSSLVSKWHSRTHKSTPVHLHVR